jgi:hypothetical protein
MPQWTRPVSGFAAFQPDDGAHVPCSLSYGAWCAAGDLGYE